MGQHKVVSRWKLIWDQVDTNKLVRSILLWLGVFILAKPVGNFISKDFKAEFLKSTPTEGNLWLISLFIILVIVIQYWSLCHIKKYTPSANLAFNSVIFCISYCYFRGGSLSNSLTFDCLLDYVDLLLVLVLIYILFFFISLFPKAKPTASESPLFEDREISEDKDDSFRYSGYAQKVATSIKSTTPSKAFVIGINSSWGGGKTSLMNLIKNNLKDEKIIVIDFYPWRSSHKNKIVTDFFDALKEGIETIFSNLSTDIDSYVDKLNEVQESAFTKILKAFYSFLNIQKNSPNELYEIVNNKLRLLDRKICIFIDDIDRLDHKEVVQVLKIMRNTADFYNVFYIVGYDRRYLEAAIQKINKHNADKYLDKIIQLEISLPAVDKQKLLDVLEQNLNLIFPNHTDEVKRAIRGSEGIYVYSDGTFTHFMNSFYNMRDINRISNAIKVNFGDMADNVCLYDVILVEILRFKYPSFYENIVRAGNIIVVSIGDSQNSRATEFKISEISSEYSNPQTESLLDTLLQSDSRRLDAKRHLSVKLPSRFRIYFRYSLDSEINEIGFADMRAAEPDVFTAYIKAEIQKAGYAKLLLDRLLHIEGFDNRKDLTNIVSAIFELGRHYVENSFKEIFTLHSVLSTYLKNNILPMGQDIVKELVWKQVEEAPSPYVFESCLLKELIEVETDVDLSGEGILGKNEKSVGVIQNVV